MFTRLPLQWLRAHTDVRFYTTIPHPIHRYLISLLAFSYFFYALANTLLFRVLTLPRWDAVMTSAWTLAAREWPADLVLRYDGTTLAVHPATTLRLPYPDAALTAGARPAHLLSINTAEPNHRDTASLVSIGSRSMTVQNAGQSQTSPLPEIIGNEPFSIDKSTFSENSEEVGAVWRVMRMLIMAAVLVLSMLLVVARLMVLPLVVWLAQNLLRVFGIPLTWLQAWYFGLLVLIPAETLQLAARALYGDVFPSFFWFLYLALYLFISLSNHFQTRSTPEV